MENNVVVTKAPELEKVVDMTISVVRSNLKNKVQYVKGIKYDPKKVKICASKNFVEDMSSAYAFKSNVYNVNSKYRNNIAYLSSEMAKIEEKEEQDDDDKAYYALCASDRAKSQACLHAWNKAKKLTVQSTLDDIASRLYAPYVNRQVNDEGWNNAIKAYFASYGMECDPSLVRYLSDNVGSKVSSVRDWAKSMVDNMSAKAFAELFLALLLQLCVDKSVLSSKIAASTLDGVNLVMIEEFDSFKTVRRVPDTAKKAEFLAVLEDVGAEIPSEKTKANLRDAYKKAKKDGLFVEYDY